MVAKMTTKTYLQKDCRICHSTGLRISASVSLLHGWKIYMADIKSAFFLPGSAAREVFVQPP